jgi:purine-cytosine permease-like protein
MWVPVGTNLVLVVVAAVLGDRTAIALTAVAAVVNFGAVLLFLHESEQDKERIAYLQASIPTLAALEPETAVNLGSKPSTVVTQVLKQAQPTPRSLRSVPRTPIDPS